MEYFPTIEYIKIYMKGLKLTPTMMFLLLVVILVISMLLGYSIKEGMSSGSTQDADMLVFSPYDSRSLAVIKSSTDTEGAILFDPKYGNFVNVTTMGSNSMSQDADNLPFTVVRRDGSSTSYTSSTWSAAKSQILTSSQTIGNMASSNVAWSYSQFDKTIINVTWDTNTVVYVLNGTQPKPVMENVYISNFTGDNNQTTIIDDSINGSHLPTTKSTGVTTTSQNQVQINGSSANQVGENAFFSHDQGILIKTSSGYSMANSSQSVNSSIMKNDTTNNTAVVATKINLNSQTAAIVIIISAVDDSSGSLSYEITTTARVSHPSSSPSGSSSGSSVPGGKTPSSSCSSGYEISGTHNPDTGRPYCAPKDDSDSDCENDSPYILKTEIVPPVCPMCPSTGGGGGSSSSGCNVSVNSSGQLVDCHGNTVQPYSGPSSFGDDVTSGFNTTVKTAGNTIDSTVKSASDLVGSTVGTAGNVIGSTVGTAGNVVNKGLDTAGKAVGDVTGGIEGTLTGLGKDVSNIVTGVSGDVTGVANKTVGSVAGLASQAVSTTAGLAHDTGSGAYSLAEQAMYRDPYGIYYNQYGQPIQPQTQPVIYPGAPVYPSGMYQGFGSCGMPYYPPQGPDPMPITNDFSQFV
jgi:hypothetical protein